MTETPASLSLTFWGVRGSAPTPGPDTAIYGGNTACVEVDCGGTRLVFDAGTGIQNFCRAVSTGDLDLFLSHSHIDHICGLPYLATHRPRGATCRLWVGHLESEGQVQHVLEAMMAAPIFPIHLDDMPLTFDIRLFRAGDTLSPHPGIEIRTAPLSHPDRAIGYRVDFAGKSIAYVTDTEHVPDLRDPAIVELIRDADLFIYDSTFSDESFAPKIGWGHSTWQEGVRLADAAGVKTYAVFHHDPERDDAAMDDIARAVARARLGSIVARDGMVVRL